MKIENIDKNFKQVKNNNEKYDEYPMPNENVSMHGLHFDKNKGFYRLDFNIADNASEGIKYLNFHTAGGRIVFKTDSSFINLKVEFESIDKMYHMPITGSSSFYLNEIIDSKEVFKGLFSPGFSDEHIFTLSCQKFNGSTMRTYILHFPLYNRVKNLSLLIEKGSKIEKANIYKPLKPILYYGSSITQGGCASRPDNSYQDFIARWTQIDYINLGFSGNAKGEEIIKNYLSTIESSIFILDYDFNADNAEHLKNTHFNLYNEYRKNHKTNPIIILSAPGHSIPKEERIKRNKIIKATYLIAKNNGDKNVYFIDGSKIFPKDIAYQCNIDGIHPNDLGFYFIAKKIYKIIKKALYI